MKAQHRITPPPAGIVACCEYLPNGNILYAQIEPSGGPWYRQFLPSVQRWWFEIYEAEEKPSDDLPKGVIAYFFHKPWGAGGAWTLRGAMIKASLAIDEAVEERDKLARSQAGKE